MRRFLLSTLIAVVLVIVPTVFYVNARVNTEQRARVEQSCLDSNKNATTLDRIITYFENNVRASPGTQKFFAGLPRPAYNPNCKEHP